MLSKDQPLPAPNDSAQVAAPCSAYRWTIANDKTGEVTTYHSAMRKPVTEKHVRESPKVKEWSGGDPLVITPQNTMLYQDQPLPLPNDSAQVEAGINPPLDELKALTLGNLQAQHLTGLTRAIVRNDLSASFSQAQGKVSPAQIQDCLHFIQWEMPANLVNQLRSC